MYSIVSQALEQDKWSVRNNNRIRVSTRQMEMIVTAVELNPYLNKPTFSRTYSVEQRYKDWAALSNKLNHAHAGGAVKTVEKWKKCWIDYKTEVKRRFRGLTKRTALSAVEERTAIIMGLDVTRTERQPMELEISNVESIKDMSSTSDGMESANCVAEPKQPESNNLITLVPVSQEFNPVTIIRVKIDPDDVSSKANESPQTGTANIVSMPNHINPVPMVSTSNHTNQVTLVSTSNYANSVPLVSTPNRMNQVTFVSTPNYINPVSKESSQTKSSPAHKKGGNKVEINTEDLFKAQIATAGALETLAKALETMAETQKAHLAMEEKRTALFEKLIDHFCNK